MQTSEILASISEEIARLQQVRNLLAGSDGGRAKPGRKGSAPAISFPFGTNGTAPRKRRTISAAGRARIAAAQKARWAKLKKAKVEKK